MSTDRRQQQTGKQTEASVAERLASLGLRATKPVPDHGIDLEVRLPGRETPVLRLQIKGRGPIQRNGRFRWFQIRTTAAQRERALSAGLSVTDAWEAKVKLCDFFVLVAQKFAEYWVLPQSKVLEIGKANRLVYGNRADNRTGKQAELDLDIEFEGTPLTVLHRCYLDSFDLIRAELERRMAELGDACDG